MAAGSTARLTTTGMVGFKYTAFAGFGANAEMRGYKFFHLLPDIPVEKSLQKGEEMVNLCYP